MRIPAHASVNDAGEVAVEAHKSAPSSNLSPKGCVSAPRMEKGRGILKETGSNCPPFEGPSRVWPGHVLHSTMDYEYIVEQQIGKALRRLERKHAKIRSTRCIVSIESLTDRPSSS